MRRQIPTIVRFATMKKSVLPVLGVFMLACLFLTDSHTSSAAEAVPTPTPVASPTVKPTPRIDDPDEIIKIDTELVNLNVRVVDRNNRPVNNLAEKDFKIYEDGK